MQISAKEIESVWTGAFDSDLLDQNECQIDGELVCLFLNNFPAFPEESDWKHKS